MAGPSPTRCPLKPASEPTGFQVRIAVIDVGTNTTRLYIAEVIGGTITAEITRTSTVTRLGAGVDASGRLGDEALAREYSALAEYNTVLKTSAVDRAVAVMTSAVRDAANGQELADTISVRFGLEAQILNGDEEARMTYLGATSDLDRGQYDAEHPILVIDIGGGSTEFVLGHGEQLDFHVSTQAGVVRQADRHISHDPPTEAELDATAADVRAILEAAVAPEHRTGVGRALAVAGTPTALAAIAQELEPYDPSRVHGYVVTAQERDEILARLRTLSLAERQRVPGLHPARADVILPGIVILTEVMNLFGLDAVEASEHDILRGAALAYSREWHVVRSGRARAGP
jgi:exopolyphosphatase/guanosine-5'-triphosphate,3'-diphosphate pyrophosphatase